MITNLKALNFRGLRNAEIETTSPVTLVLGQNGAGKSSLAGAIEYALTGQCEWTDKAGKGYAALIGYEGQSLGAQVEVTLDGARVARQLTPKGTAVEFSNPQGVREGKDALAALSMTLPAPALLATMLRSDGLIGLPAKEQQDVLFALAGGETDAAWFRARLTEQEAEILDADLSSLVKGSALATKLHSAAYTLRTAANKWAKEQAAKLQAFTAPAPGTGDADDFARQAQALRVDLGKLQQQIGAAQSQETAHAQAAARQQKAAEDVQRYETALAELEATMPQGAADLEQLSGELDAARAACTQALQEAANLEAGRLARQEQLDRFVALDGSCVLGGVACAMDPAARGDVIRKEQSAIDKLEGALSAAKQDAETAAKTAQALDQQVRTAIRDAQVSKSAQQDRERLTGEIARAKQAMLETVTEAKQAKGVDLDALQARSEELGEQIAVLEQQEREARQALNAVTEQARLTKEAREAGEYAALLDGLVKKLGPDGLPAQAMAETIGGVLAAINDVLARFTEFVLSAEPGQEFALSVTRGGHLTPVACLSEGERLMVGAAVQVAVAELTGFGFCVVDAADRLDQGNRGALLEMLLCSGVRSLVLATPATDQIPTGIPGLRVYVLEDGAAVVAAEECAA